MPGKGKKVKHGHIEQKLSRAMVDDGQHKFGRLIEIRGNVAPLAVSEQLAGDVAAAMAETPADDAARASALATASPRCWTR